MEEIVKLVGLITRVVLFIIQAICDLFAYGSLDKIFASKFWMLYVVLIIGLITIAFYFTFQCDIFERCFNG